MGFQAVSTDRLPVERAVINDGGVCECIRREQRPTTSGSALLFDRVYAVARRLSDHAVSEMDDAALARHRTHQFQFPQRQSKMPE